MIKNYFVTALRNVVKNWSYSLLNIIGLSTGLAATIYISLFIIHELTYDQMHEKGENIYRTAVLGQMMNNTFDMAVTASPMAQAMLEDYPDVEQVCRIYRSGDWLLRYDDLKFNEENQMQFRLLFYVSLIVLVLSNVSFRWPLNNGKITSTFGESRWDHFHDGVDMISSDEKIYPVEAGQLLYFWNRSLFPLESYPGAGNYKILKHSNGIYSIYMHMTDEISLRKIYTKNDPLGFIGNTGHSFSKHIHFTIADSNKNITVNPFGKLPVYADKKKT